MTKSPQTFSLSDPLMEAGFRRVSLVGCVVVAEKVDFVGCVEGSSQRGGEGNCLFLLQEGEYCLPFLNNPRLCFLNSK